MSTECPQVAPLSVNCTSFPTKFDTTCPDTGAGVSVYNIDAVPLAGPSKTNDGENPQTGNRTPFPLVSGKGEQVFALALLHPCGVGKYNDGTICLSKFQLAPVQRTLSGDGMLQCGGMG